MISLRFIVFFLVALAANALNEHMGFGFWSGTAVLALAFISVSFLPWMRNKAKVDNGSNL